MAVYSSRWTKIGLTVLLAFICTTVAALFPKEENSLGAKEGGQSSFGPYLAGRFARTNRDTKAAADYFRKALERDPTNELFLEEAFYLEASAGNWPESEKLAKKIVKKNPSHALANTLLAVNAVNKGQLEEADKYLSVKIRGPIAELTTELAKAWILYAKGQSSKAIKLLSKPGKAEWVNFYKLYHKGLIADLAGNTEIATASFSAIFAKDPRALRIASTYARHTAAAGHIDLAIKIVKQNIAKAGERPDNSALLKTLEDNQVPPRLVNSVKEGMAEIYYGFGDALTAENGIDMATIYLHMALGLRPDFPVAYQSLANAYETVAQRYEKMNKSDDLIHPKYQAAVDAYNKIPSSDPMWDNIQIRKAYNLNLLDKVDEAQELLQKIIEKNPGETQPLDALGDILRAHKRFEEAAEYYGKAIDTVKNPSKQHWTLFYSRGVCYERTKNWQKAEKDLQKALELSPNQPLVLNYLGYSWIDQNLRLKEAMQLIRKAVKLKPDDGYFVDSLGWAHYRQNNFENAVVELEKAVELRPDDPVINDHLGDAYWQVGRRNEAKFQWSQALTLKPEEQEIVKIKAKLKDGLNTGDTLKTVSEETNKAPEVKQ